VEDAKELIRQALAEHTSIYVGFSGGKDSTALLHLVMQVNPDVPVIFFDHGRNLVPARHVREARRIAQACGCQRLRIIRRKQQVKEGEYVSEDPTAQWMFRIISKLGYEAVLLGIRGEESIARRRRGKDVTNRQGKSEGWSGDAVTGVHPEIYHVWLGLP
jgi:3'-phosphoadenosine 5'-phosphosulfate sulfotransferase (PAPS reductase)/FAD synthetase